jgi:hypothetical protein
MWVPSYVGLPVQVNKGTVTRSGSLQKRENRNDQSNVKQNLIWLPCADISDYVYKTHYFALMFLGGLQCIK